jgi:hypothetical protein
LHDFSNHLEDTHMSMIARLSPTATNMIRADHTTVLAAFHRYKAEASTGVKQALVATICLALEIHAQLEDEIFYPALRAVDAGAIEKNGPEHDEMRRLIAMLGEMEAGSSYFDRTFLELMRLVMHHMADEETVALPRAEELLGSERLSELGAEMTKRRLQLAAPRAGERVKNAVNAKPTTAVLVGLGALAAGTLAIAHAVKQRTLLR